MIYQWAFFYFTTSIGYGTRRTKYGPLFTSLEAAKQNLDQITQQYGSSFHVGFIFEFIVNELCYGKIIYKTNESLEIDLFNAHTQHNLEQQHTSSLQHHTFAQHNSEQQHTSSLEQHTSVQQEINR